MNSRVPLWLIGLAFLAPSTSAWQSSATQAPPHAPVGAPHLGGVTATELAGRSLTTYPHFSFERTFFEGTPVSIAVDPTVYPDVVGQSARIWVTAHRSEAQWLVNRTLVDARAGGPQTVTFAGGDIQSNVFVVDPGGAGTTLLSGYAYDGYGVSYDVVLDFDQDGQLSVGDWMDGLSTDAGFYVAITPTQVGPHPVTEVLYSGGTFLGQNLYYPTDILTLGELPLVVISHGNGHQYIWYDHIGYHLASYGFIVMSHQNNTSPGIETASTTTLTNTDYLLTNLGTIAGGILQGHLDRHRISWFGHSRGGEGVTRAYDRIFDGAYTPVNYVLSDIKLVSSIAPTDFLGNASANAHGANYHLWTGGADADVNGCADCSLCQTFHLHERVTNVRQSISLHGAGHGAFHDGGGSTVSTGPCLLSRPDTHLIMKAYILPLVKRYNEGNIAALDTLYRQWESFQAPGVPTTSCIIVDLMYENTAAARRFVIDNFQTQTALTTSSSGGAVTFDVTNAAEGRYDDPDTVFTNLITQPMNGMTFSGSAADTTAGLVFDFDTNRSLAFAVVPGSRDWRDFDFLSFRACQATRHPLTTAVLGDLTFQVRLHDENGGTGTISIGAYGGGIEEPYQRTACGTGAGWANEFETVRMRLEDFTRNGATINLARINSVEFLFGPAHGSTQGRLGFDDLEVVRD